MQVCFHIVSLNASLFTFGQLGLDARRWLTPATDRTCDRIAHKLGAPRRRLIAEHIKVLQILSDIDEDGINSLAWSEEVRFRTHPQWESDEENNAMLRKRGILVSRPKTNDRRSTHGPADHPQG